MTDIEEIITAIKGYQDKTRSLEALQSWLQTLPLYTYASEQQVKELEEQLENIRFLASDEKQHEMVVRCLNPIKNHLERLCSSRVISKLEDLISGKDISMANAQHIEALLDAYYGRDEVIQDFITDLALYRPGGGEYLYSHAEIVPKANYILAYMKANNCKGEQPQAPLL